MTKPSRSSLRRRIYTRPRAEAEAEALEEEEGSGERCPGTGSEAAMGESSGSASFSVDVERISFGGKVRVRRQAPSSFLASVPFQMGLLLLLQFFDFGGGPAFSIVSGRFFPFKC